MWLCVANLCVAVLIWLAMGLKALAGVSDGWILALFALPASAMEALTHPWTIITYMFAQADILQLLFNMLWLIWFGRMLSDTDSQSATLTLYAGGGLTGGICYLIAGAAMGGGSFLMGSSASILSLMVYTTLRQPDREVPLLLIGNVRLKWIAIVTIVITLLGATGIPAHCAHIGGILFPFLLLAWRRLARPFRTREPRRHAPRAFRSGTPLMRHTTPGETPEQTLDRLLDKVRVSGFDSLTRKEKDLLDEISSKLD